jgi:hypothetical protein
MLDLSWKIGLSPMPHARGPFDLRNDSQRPSKSWCLRGQRNGSTEGQQAGSRLLEHTRPVFGSTKPFGQTPPAPTRRGCPLLIPRSQVRSLPGPSNMRRTPQTRMVMRGQTCEMCGFCGPVLGRCWVGKLALLLSVVVGSPNELAAGSGRRRRVVRVRPRPRPASPRTTIELHPCSGSAASVTGATVVGGASVPGVQGWTRESSRRPRLLACASSTRSLGQIAR